MTVSERILLACYDAPGWGGAATVAYLLFERMQRDGFDVAYLSLIGARDGAFLRSRFGDQFANPRSLHNVHTCTLDDPLWRSHDAVADLVAALSPDILVGYGFIAAWLVRQAAAGVPVVFLPAGSRALQQLIEEGAVGDFMGFQRSVGRGLTFLVSHRDRERQIVETCDLIVTHSPIVQFAFAHFFPTSVGKIYANLISVADFVYAEAEAFSACKRPFAQRDIDVICIANSWRRPIKNFALVQKIAARCAGLSVHIVGEVDQPPATVHSHGVVARRADVYALLGRSKTIVCPSLLDAAPGVLFEASAMGCNVVASPDCGNWQLCNEQPLAPRCTQDAFLGKIELAMADVYPDNRDHFYGGYADLVDTLSVF